MRAAVKGVSRREQKKWMGGRWNAYLNGEDISNRCFYADEARGVVRLYHHDGGNAVHGKVYLLTEPPANGRRLANDWRGPLTVELRGKVRLERVHAA